MKIINVVGARPNFMKMAPIIEALNRYPNQFQYTLVHTGQHYDDRMVGNSKVQILEAAQAVLDQPSPKSRVPEKWDGRAAERIVEMLLRQ